MVKKVDLLCKVLDFVTHLYMPMPSLCQRLYNYVTKPSASLRQLLPLLRLPNNNVSLTNLLAQTFV